jgi:hypothetical protein
MEEEYIFLAGTSAQWSKASNTIARWCNARFEDLSSSYSLSSLGQTNWQLARRREREGTNERERAKETRELNSNGSFSGFFELYPIT